MLMKGGKKTTAFVFLLRLMPWWCENELLHIFLSKVSQLSDENMNAAFTTRIDIKMQNLPFISLMKLTMGCSVAENRFRAGQKSVAPRRIFG